MAVKNVYVCPTCREGFFGNGMNKCPKCDGAIIGTQYTELFWNKISVIEKNDYIKKVLGEAEVISTPEEAPISPFERSFSDFFNKINDELDRDKPIFDLIGNRGRKIKIYKDKVEIKTEVTIGSVLTGNATDGIKTIYFSDVIGVQFKKSGSLIGYLQFETATPIMNNTESSFFNENTFTFDTNNYSNWFMQNVYNYVIIQMNKVKRVALSYYAKNQ